MTRETYTKQTYYSCIPHYFLNISYLSLLENVVAVLIKLQSVQLNNSCNIRIDFLFTFFAFSWRFIITFWKTKRDRESRKISHTKYIHKVVQKRPPKAVVAINVKKECPKNKETILAKYLYGYFWSCIKASLHIFSKKEKLVRSF